MNFPMDLNHHSLTRPGKRLAWFHPRVDWLAAAFIAGSLYCSLLFSAAAAESFANSDCLDCHLDPTTSRTVNGKTVKFLFNYKLAIKNGPGKDNIYLQPGDTVVVP